MGSRYSHVMPCHLGHLGHAMSPGRVYSQLQLRAARAPASPCLKCLHAFAIHVLFYELFPGR